MSESFILPHNILSSVIRGLHIRWLLFSAALPEQYGHRVFLPYKLGSHLCVQKEVDSLINIEEWFVFFFFSFKNNELMC